jgi:CheY-like chemotaxis protein/two-component sensor histidine kinase
LRNPLAPIRTGMDLLAQSPEEPARAQTLGVMRRQISHMVRLIDDLLDVSRITRGKLELKRERVSLASVISSAIEASRPLIERKQHTLQVAVSDRSLVFDADHTRIAQVIGNLLNNASNYTPAGGRIELSAEREGEWAVIQVRDNGIGIPRDRLEDVFEMFSQVNRTLERSQGGLGIGLALVRSLLAMHGGTVRAESAGADLGSTFTVRLPLAASAVQQAPAAESAEPPAERSRRILVVDDNEDAADLLRLVLEQAGYLTQTAYDGPSALTMVESFRPQIVILDIGLPGMSGYEVARALRQDARFAALALIALTGWGTPGDKQKAQEAGFDLHLTKPVDARGLNGALSQLEDKAAAAPFQQTG